MTSDITREDAIRNRLANAAERPWVIQRHDLDIYIESADMGLQANLGYVGNRPEAEAELIVNAPDDLEYLLAKLARYEAAVAAGRELTKKWDTFDTSNQPRYESQFLAILKAELGE